MAFFWVKRTEGPATTFDDFRDSEGFYSLDAKLAAALTKIATGELGRRITLMVEQEASKNRMLKGRQILWMIHDNHKLDEERGALYDFTDLLAIRLKGDNQLGSFMTTWESVLSAMAHPPSPNIIEVLFLEQLRHSSALRDEIAIYDRSRKERR